MFFCATASTSAATPSLKVWDGDKLSYVAIPLDVVAQDQFFFQRINPNRCTVSTLSFAFWLAMTAIRRLAASIAVTRFTARPRPAFFRSPAAERLRSWTTTVGRSVPKRALIHLTSCLGDVGFIFKSLLDSTG